jgi:hypothetical protein
MNYVFRQVEAKHASLRPTGLICSGLVGVICGPMESVETNSGIVIIVLPSHVCISSARQSLLELI